ncbi:hypothetical protein VTL71DRAFT_9302 [Oculimacula yallundae]|uniref:Antigenic cell wall galactomannoprotein n=1 Tax=Oculimacula yallundae TaxID=86028 RepID=A0ABR4BU76_9HELO
MLLTQLLLTQLLLPVTLLITQVLADGASISAAIDKISAAAIQLNETVAEFPDNPIYGLTDIGDLLIDSTAVLKSIKQATKVAEASGELTLLEAIGLAGKITSLASGVQSTLDSTVAAKPKFDKLLVVSPVVLINLKLQKSATEEFGSKVVEKVPVDLRPIAENLQKPILEAFDKAIASYKKF